MRIISAFFLAATAVQLIGCSTIHSKPSPVITVYHVKPGAEQRVRQLVGQLWETYQREGIAFAKPHVCVETQEGNQGRRIVEIFTLQSEYAMEYPPESVKLLLGQIRPLCEARNGTPIEFQFVDTLDCARAP